MLPEVTAVFPSITLASWASIFTGKQPGETGILGNEFFARDFYDSATPNNQAIPGMQGLPSGMVTLSDGAFSNSSIGFFMYNLLPAHNYAETVQEKLDMSSPNQSLSPEKTTISGAPTVQTIYEWLQDENSLQPYFRNPEACMNGGDCRSAVFFNHYARGTDWWGTVDLVWWKKIGVDIEWLGEFVRKKLGPEKAAKTLDETPTEEALDFLDAYYTEDDSDLGYNKEKRFPALFTVYYGGLDHYAHDVGMDGHTEHYTGYTDYFQRKTDVEISILVDKLKELGEFDNKIFIITSDHGHTAMATDLIYKREKTFVDPESGYEETIVDYPPADTSCSLKLDFQLDPDNPEAGRNNRRSEQANNNLHIWELGSYLKTVGEFVEQATTQVVGNRILAPEEIARLFVEPSTGQPLRNGAAEKEEDANIIAAMNGPMAHIYVKGSDWSATPDINRVLEVAEIFRVTLQGARGGDSPLPIFPSGSAERFGYKVGRMANSIDEILVRNSGIYKVYTVDNSTGAATIVLKDLSSLSAQYVEAVDRIEKMNNSKRSGDIVLIMKDDADIPQGENIENHRYTTGVACKSWHGSLNRSDSYIPFIFAYPGGNKTEIDNILKEDAVCSNDYSNCKGNWKMVNIIKKIIQKQY